MKTKQDKKAEQLGMPFGTANAKLRKMILFHLVKQYELDICYRCTEKIQYIEEFTIEHKKAWLDVDPKLFWDLNNIAFSHLNCNVKAARSGNTTNLCWMCKNNPPRRLGRNKWAKECQECNNKRVQGWRLRKRGIA